ncbi:hypothetical protein [Actinoalloteichus fjordicus]|uniref:Uncharacterized protein n=1 Tax=Actinoalloteichus fjordicus TaxID=1612552 RepID=A0AAC9LAP0_9PSEU|nr:hypothetical protein [Actinoalloteichus fjordicus]APU13172.1 hypothetical protein UA74_05480 [Actinoalloteichus fjordicus]
MIKFAPAAAPYEVVVGLGEEIGPVDCAKMMNSPSRSARRGRSLFTGCSRSLS